MQERGHAQITGYIGAADILLFYGEVPEEDKLDGGARPRGGLSQKGRYLKTPKIRGSWAKECGESHHGIERSGVGGRFGDEPMALAKKKGSGGGCGGLGPLK